MSEKKKRKISSFTVRVDTVFQRWSMSVVRLILNVNGLVCAKLANVDVLE